MACRAALVVFGLLYAAALFLLAVGTFGLFGNERDPLAGVFLLPLGLPWNLMLDWAPEALLPWLTAGMPLLNGLILWIVCRRLGRR